MIQNKKAVFTDLLQVTFAAVLCLVLGLSCIVDEKAESKGPVHISTADKSVITSSKKEPRTYDLKIIHPGDPKSEPIDLKLVQSFDEQGNPKHYSLWVDSVICRDKTCEVVKVEMFWDAFGQYDKYFVEFGEKLTKLDHIPFSSEDHAKLQRILNDKESPLREVTKDGLVGEKAKSAVDGVAGATVLTLNSTVVVGAGYTCYDLWHWANGEVSQIIRQKSGQAFSVSKLKELLQNKKVDTVQFAITYLKERQVFDQTTVNAVIESMKIGGDELIESAVAYLKKASKTPADYFRSLQQIFVDCSSNKRVFILTSITEDSQLPSASFYDLLSKSIPDLKSYHEVHIMLTLFEKRKAWSPEIENNVVELLNHPKFFFSRRAYWFLKKNKVSAVNQPKVDAFFKKHQLRLL